MAGAFAQLIGPVNPAAIKTLKFGLPKKIRLLGRRLAAEFMASFSSP